MGWRQSLVRHACGSRQAGLQCRRNGRSCSTSIEDKVIYFDETDVVEVDIPDAKVFKKAAIFKPVLDADVIINLPKMKVHIAGGVTLGLKKT